MKITTQPIKHSVAALIIAVASIASLGAETIRAHGSNAFWAAINPQLETLKSATGADVTLVPNSAGRGLQDLVEGRCELTLFAGNFKSAVEQINKKTPGKIADASTYQVHPVGLDEVVFVVHKDNPVAKLTLEQAKTIMSGAVKNWKDVGGADMAIIVFSYDPSVSGPISALQTVLKEEKIVADARLMKTPRDMPVAIAQSPGAIGFLGTNNLKDTVKRIETDAPFGMELAIVSKGEPTPAQKTFIETTKPILKGK